MEEDKPTTIKIEKNEDLSKSSCCETLNIESDQNKIYIKVEPNDSTQLYENETLVEIANIKQERDEDYPDVHCDNQHTEIIKIDAIDIKLERDEDYLNSHSYNQHTGNINIDAIDLKQEHEEIHPSTVQPDISHNSQDISYANLVASMEETQFSNPCSGSDNIHTDIMKSDEKEQCLNADGRDPLDMSNLKQRGKIIVKYSF